LDRFPFALASVYTRPSSPLGVFRFQRFNDKSLLKPKDSMKKTRLSTVLQRASQNFSVVKTETTHHQLFTVSRAWLQARNN